LGLMMYKAEWMAIIATAISAESIQLLVNV
jgi:hypothetical protein